MAVTLVMLSGIFFVIERIVGRGRNRQQPVFRAGWLTDVVYLFVTVLVTKPFVRLMIIVPAGFLGQMWEPFAWLLRRGKKVHPSA